MNSRPSKRDGVFTLIYQGLAGYEAPTHTCYDQGNEEILLDLSKADDRAIVRAYDVLRAEIKREDDLINQRNTWALLLSASMFAALAAAASKVIERGAQVDLIIEAFGAVMILGGLASSYFCMGAVAAARMQIEYLFCNYYENQETFRKLGLPRPFGRRRAHESGIGYSQKTPATLFTLWLMIGGFWAIYSFMPTQSSNIQDPTKHEQQPGPDGAISNGSVPPALR